MPLSKRNLSAEKQAAEENGRRQARHLYVSEKRSEQKIAETMAVTRARVRKWRALDQASGIDWGRTRQAAVLSTTQGATIARELLGDYMAVHEAALRELRTDEAISSVEKAKVIASLSASFNRTVKAAGRAAPEIAKFAIATEVLTMLGDYLVKHHTDHARLFVHVLDDFSLLIAEHYGDD